MNTRYDRENDLQDLHDSRGQDREISLGTTTILGIFFALALLCAVFFGFGYGLGRRSAQAVGYNAAETTTAGSEGSTSKPAPGSPAVHAASLASTKAVRGQTSTTADDTATGVAAEESPETPAAAPVRAEAGNSHQELRSEAATKSAPKPVAFVPSAAARSTTAPATAPSTTATSTTAAVSPGSPVVQVAAVSHQEDADVLLTALKRRGYNVAIRQMPQDKLLHVQIGPFATKKEADAMRQRLQTDGYNAIVK